MLILSGGTSKGAGDVSHRIIARLGPPGIIAHGVALKPGKPLCLAVCDGKPVVILPGFPTSAMFTFHDMIVPVLRRMAGLPPRADTTVAARLPLRVASELGRTEFVMVSLVEGGEGLVAYPTGKGSGAITSFAQADGFIRIEALADHLPAGSAVEVRLFARAGAGARPRHHRQQLHRASTSSWSRSPAPALSRGCISVGSLGGLAAARRGECDLAPIHLLEEKSGRIQRAVPGARARAGARLAAPAGHRASARATGASKGSDARGRRACRARRSGLPDGQPQPGRGTRILIDALLGPARPDGYVNQPRSHNAVAAAVAGGRADWGVTIEPVARAAGLGFIPLAEEHYDFALVAARKDRPAVRAFLEALASEEAEKGAGGSRLPAGLSGLRQRKAGRAGSPGDWLIPPCGGDGRQPEGGAQGVNGLDCRRCHHAERRRDNPPRPPGISPAMPVAVDWKPKRAKRSCSSLNWLRTQQRGQPFGFGEVFRRVGVEERIDRLGRPGDGGSR